MPTIMRFASLRVVVYPNDHRPAHVHVIGRGCEAVFELRCPSGPPIVCENFGFARSDMARILEALTSGLALLCFEWERFHGEP